MKPLLAFSLLVCSPLLYAQNGSWQQRVDYHMHVDMDVKHHRYKGVQKLIYTNHSPDTLRRVFYHLYWNAFQPGSEMDWRLRTIRDPDKRMVKTDTVKGATVYHSRIAVLKADEIGYERVSELEQDGVPLRYRVQGTILEVQLAEPLLPGAQSRFEMKWEAQVPLQIRRSGRGNAEGVDFSMTQWYPKMAEYDVEGWHADEYIAREFHGVFGDFDVWIEIDKNYVIGGSGVLQNPESVKGYGGHPKVRRGKVHWHFKAHDIHDFAFAADPDFKVETRQVPGGPKLYFVYQKGEKTALWHQAEDYTVRFFTFMNPRFGRYPYPVYSVVQGGDGGMEYGMCTLVVGNAKTVEGLSSLIFHEATHSWFQHALATNETEYAWMDEGFTEYVQDLTKDRIFKLKQRNPFARAYGAYYEQLQAGAEEPARTFSDHFNTNRAYVVASYFKGELFLVQLGYLIGEQNLQRTLKRYFHTWKFKHPRPMDFIRVAEKVSGLQLKWYLNYWISTTRTIDYGIKSVTAVGNKTRIVLENRGGMPMPIDLYLADKTGHLQLYYIPLACMRGEKLQENSVSRAVLPDWGWTIPTYSLVVDVPQAQIEQLVIDASLRLADVDYGNNFYPRPVVKGKQGK